MDNFLLEIILFTLLIFIAAFLAAAEIAIASFGQNKIEELKEKEDPMASVFEKINKNPDSFFGTIQIISTISLMSSAILAYKFSSKLFILPLTQLNYVLVSSNADIFTFIFSVVVVSLFILIFCILIPKVVGFKYAESIGRKSVRILIVLTSTLKYPVNFITKISNFLLTPFKEKTSFTQTRFSEDEIRLIISDSVEAGELNETEQKIIENIFAFNDLRANEVMVPRIDMVALEFKENEQEITEEVIKTGHSLIPVYEESIDNIIGVLHTKDVMKTIIQNQKVKLKSLLRPVYFIPETKLISEILKEMQNRGERLAIVTDEYGGTEGLITMEDILEEIVGEIKDSNEVEVKEFYRLPDGKFYILGSVFIDDFNEVFNIELPKSDEYNTIAGFISEKTGKILNTGEIFEFENLHFELIKKIRQKMVQFKVYATEGSFIEKPKEDSSNR